MKCCICWPWPKATGWGRSCSARAWCRPPGRKTQERELSLLAGLDGSLKARMEELESRVIREVLVRQRWNKTRAAAELGLSRVGLRSKLARYGLEKAENKGPERQPEGAEQ